ncbi:MAG: flavin reductase family protein [Chloroflexota bacterium]|nr:flavin reductase family protein [Chloroflexota bacterium]
MKLKLGAKNCLYPMPTTLVGAIVNGKPNYITIAHVGIMDLGSISLGMNKRHYTNDGIKENGTFSVNVPSVEMVKETDYCGLVSGKKVDKGDLFESFYGRLKTAPMIRECPINMECRLIQTVDFPRHDVFVGEIVETYCDEQYLTDGVVDFSKVQPILFVMNDKSYWKLGERFASAWNVGMELKRR